MAVSAAAELSPRIIRGGRRAMGRFLFRNFTAANPSNFIRLASTRLRRYPETINEKVLCMGRNFVID
jgi:hypothetical protein